MVSTCERICDSDRLQVEVRGCRVRCYGVARRAHLVMRSAGASSPLCSRRLPSRLPSLIDAGGLPVTEPVSGVR